MVMFGMEQLFAHHRSITARQLQTANPMLACAMGHCEEILNFHHQAPLVR
uniref:Uncharacterized protein n=1 Tax=Anopheles atroparvus TaxID=41427 RepID=A0AAG5CPU4_ANOAO